MDSNMATKCLDPLIENYLNRVVDVLISAGAEWLDEPILEKSSHNQAKLSVDMGFSGGNRLSVHMRVGLCNDRVISRRYSMHFMNGDDSTIFRYDNSQHFQGDGDSLDHKHESDRVFACAQPSVRAVRDEIAAHLNADG